MLNCQSDIRNLTNIAILTEAALTQPCCYALVTGCSWFELGSILFEAYSNPNFVSLLLLLVSVH